MHRRVRGFGRLHARWPAAALVAALASACVDDASGVSGGGDPVVPSSSLGTTAPGLTAAAASADTLRADYRLDAGRFEGALWIGSDPAALFAAPPAVAGLVGDHELVPGMPADSTLFVGLGLRDAAAGGPYTPVGAVLRVRTRDPIYVDPSADPAVADGTTPATAFPDVLSGVLSAAAQGIGNVWLAAGDHPVGSIPLLDDVDLYGGFDADFDLATRGALASRLVGSPGVALLDASFASDPGVVDGLVLDGQDVATFGVDVSDVDIELRDLVVERCSGRGIRVRNSPGRSPIRVQLTSVEARGNLGDGLSGDGALHLTLDGSRFDSNVQEGVDLDDLVAPEGGQASLTVRGCGFFGNGTQGLDADLNAPLAGGPTGGLLAVDIRDSVFELNGEEGLLLDQDHEAAPAWRSEIEVRGVRARANGEAGVLIDADAQSSVLVHGLLSAGNGGDGLWITSESAPGLALVSGFALVANRGAGLRTSQGNRSVAVAHGVFAGNLAGGLVSETVLASTASCVAYLQAQPWVGVDGVDSLVLDLPDPSPFAVAPRAFTFALSVFGSTLTLEADPGPAVGLTVELADDDTAREVLSGSGGTLEVEPAPELFLTPGSVALFDPASTVEEDWSPTPGSPLVGAGMAGPAGSAVDAGPLGLPGAVPPGVAAFPPADLFRPTSTAPAATPGLAATEPLRVSFGGGTLDPGSVSADTVRVLGPAGPVAVGLAVLADELVLTPASTWGPGPLRVELTTGLGSLEGPGLLAGTALGIAVL